jgi:uncharacterized protein (TIGR03437 family)
MLALIVMAGARAQSQAPATLDIDTANLVIYRHDVFDATRVATEAGTTAPLPLRSFMHVTWIGDVVAVNGAPAKGTLAVRGTFVSVNPSPTPGIGIGDTTNSLASDWIFDILRADGSSVGTIVASGWAFGSRAAGFPSPGQGNLAVLGGTGAFLGVRGQGRETSVAMGAQSFASVTEDPANRRLRVGRASRYTFQLVPMERPDFVKSATGPNVFHSDFSPVTASNPATRGEVLIAAATGLGPTVSGKQPGAPFPLESLQEAASPIQVLVNGIAVNPLNQVGWPGTTETYRVDFRVPEEAAAGMASIQLVASWIPGPAIQIPVR